MATLDVSHDQAALRFVAYLDGVQVGFADYESVPGALLITHTEVDPPYGGRGVGSALAEAALDYIRESGLQVVPQCSFARYWIGKHPLYADLVA